MLFGLDASWNLFVFNAACYMLIVVVERQVDVMLPQHIFDPAHRRYRSFRWERDGDIYRDVLRIDRWKDKLPCLPARTHFSKKSIAGRQADYLEQFVVETCRSETAHVTMIVAVGVMRLWTPFDLWLVCFVIAVVGNIPFICIQRYNRPRLQRTLANIEQRRLARGYIPRPAIDMRAADVRPDQAETHSSHAS